MSDKENRIEPLDGSDHLKMAFTAAATGQVVRALEHLWASGFMDGLVRHVLSRYPDVDPDEAYTAVSEAIDEFCATARRGKTIKNPQAVVVQSNADSRLQIVAEKSVGTTHG